MAEQQERGVALADTDQTLPNPAPPLRALRRDHRRGDRRAAASGSGGTARGVKVDGSSPRAYALAYVRRCAMTTITATEARKLLYKLLDEVADSHEPVQIAGKRSNAVLIAEDDWRAIQETLYLHSIPGMKESILEGLETPAEECERELDW
jgi:PHD/YefM family antitoxin component YafN of YafNO toxin-antitoxin module